MNFQDRSSLLQNQVNELFAMFQAARSNVKRAQLNYDKVKAVGSQNAELHYAKMLKSKNLEIQTLRSKVTPDQKEISLNLQEQHAKVLIDKDMEIQTLKTQLAASQEESSRKEEELQKYRSKEHSDDRVIHYLNTCLILEEQQHSEKIKVLQEQHFKQIEGKDLELQTLKIQQVQHVKELNDKDLAIQDLTIRLSGAKQQTVDKIMELINEKDRHSQVIQKFREESLLAERRLESVRMMLKGNLRQKMKEVDLELTQLRTRLNKLYLELQEAKKSQEALMARLAAKDRKMKYLAEQLEAKDSEIQNLNEMIQGGDEVSVNLVAKDADLKCIRNGQSKK
ncbi:hypothetical protein CRE_01312 [Caenorhabditis remanei]|uniref:Uncharacterized protein n=1 Tax=Caenorhabditis remanei TaxID=31234 RepID=E3N9M0_CAERE|nr:hypothetical protein CRE_01312 [Caenorhabditis remanei]